MGKWGIGKKRACSAERFDDGGRGRIYNLAIWNLQSEEEGEDFGLLEWEK